MNSWGESSSKSRVYYYEYDIVIMFQSNINYTAANQGLDVQLIFFPNKLVVIRLPEFVIAIFTELKYCFQA